MCIGLQGANFYTEINREMLTLKVKVTSFNLFDLAFFIKECMAKKQQGQEIDCLQTSAANRLIGEVVQSRRRPLLGPSSG